MADGAYVDGRSVAVLSGVATLQELFSPVSVIIVRSKVCFQSFIVNRSVGDYRMEQVLPDTHCPEGLPPMIR